MADTRRSGVQGKRGRPKTVVLEASSCLEAARQVACQAHLFDMSPSTLSRTVSEESIKPINILSPYYESQHMMLGILQQIRNFLLRAAKWYSPVRLLQCLLAFCRAVFRRCKSKSLAEERMGTSVGHLIPGSQAPPSASIDPVTIQPRPQSSSLYVCD